MKRSTFVQRFLLLLVICMSLLFLSCGTVPITGRRQLSLIPSYQLQSMSFQSYGEFLSKHKIGGSVEQTKAVQRVGRRIQRAVENYFASRNMTNQLSGYQWEFNLIESPDANAWCMPGGKVVVYTGILPVAGDEAGLATVLAHEIAHAVADHGNERMSHALLAELGSTALSEALAERPEETRKWFATAYGLGAQVGLVLPFSRLHELEADRLGLVFMAMAGYDPRAAVGFWQRMAQSKKNPRLTDFLSTHPSDSKRISAIEAAIPEALSYYKGQAKPNQFYQ